MIGRFDLLKYRNLRIIPTYHSNLDFVHEVRSQFYSEIPDIIAVEFPPNLKKSIIQGVSRLPKISIILYFDDILKEQLYIPISPSDSLIEAIRLSREYGLPLEFIDLFVKNYNPEIFQMPDAYGLDHLNLNEFYDIIKNQMNWPKKAELEILNQQKERELKKKIIESEQDFLESEGKMPVSEEKEITSWINNRNEIDELRNNHMAARLNQLMEEYPQDVILVIIGMSHWESIRILLEKKEFSKELSALEIDINPSIFNMNNDEFAKISLTTPNIVYQFNVFREKQKNALDRLSSKQFSNIELEKFDQFLAIDKIISRAIKKYSSEYHESISPYKMKSLIQYLRNISITDSKVRPQLFEIVLASKSVISDDFAWIVWDECKKFPRIETNDDDLEDIQLTREGIFLNGKYFKIRRSIPIHLRKLKLPLKPKPKERHPGEWRDYWIQNQGSLVSYIPEDIFEENYFQHIRKRTMRLLKEEFYHVHEFTSTLMDGIDFRHTIRNWALEHKIYVREELKIKGNVDAVVIIFDKDEKKREQYPYRMIWYAEHDEESDLAFYSTYPGIDLVGPGISRIELGGVASFFPPRGIPNIWTRDFDKHYPMFKTKSEKLLMASLLFAQKPYITVIAEQKPKEIIYQIARQLKVKIIYLSLDRFNPVSLRALRNLHVLAGRQTRRFAHKYIKKRKY